MLIAFDLDDTLYKERDFVLSGYHAVARKLADKYGLDFNEMVHTMTHTQLNPFDSLMEYLTNRALQRGLTISEDIPWMVETYRNHKPDISLSEGVEETLTSLICHGHRLALITDGRSATQRNKIEALRLDRFIDDRNISISEEIGAEKYNPDAFRRIMTRNPDIKDFVYVGDNPMKDFLWPNRFGWMTVQLNDNGRNVHSQSIAPHTSEYVPMFTINSLSELLQMIH